MVADVKMGTIIKNSKQIFALLAMALSSTFCTQTDQSFFSEFQSTNGGWEITDVKNFSFEQKDTVANYKVYLRLQANNDYPFSNIYLITKIHAPSSQIYIDTLEYEMADVNGELLGEGFTDTKTSKLLYKENYSFAEQGMYIIEVEQAVRRAEDIEGATTLKGITGVGLTIEKQ